MLTAMVEARLMMKRAIAVREETVETWF